MFPSKVEVNKDRIQKFLFNRRAKIEQEVDVHILDVPKMHDYKERISDQFFKVIAKADFELFTSVAVQKLIDYKY